MFTLTIYLVQHGMIAEMNRTSPPGMPNVFLIDIAPKDRDAVVDLVKRQRGVEGAPEADRHRGLPSWSTWTVKTSPPWT